VQKFHSSIVVCESRSNKKFALSYYINTSIIKVEGRPVKVYGVRIHKRWSKKKCIHFEDKIVRNVTTSEADILEFANILYRNKVTPMHLLDVAEDYILEKENEIIMKLGAIN